MICSTHAPPRIFTLKHPHPLHAKLYCSVVSSLSLGIISRIKKIISIPIERKRGFSQKNKKKIPIQILKTLDTCSGVGIYSVCVRRNVRKIFRILLLILFRSLLNLSLAICEYVFSSLSLLFFWLSMCVSVVHFNPINRRQFAFIAFIKFSSLRWAKKHCNSKNNFILQIQSNELYLKVVLKFN